MAHSVFMFVPAFGNTIKTPTFLCTHSVMQELHNKGIGTAISSLSFPDIAELRSMILTIWYDTMPQVSHLLFVDADMAFPPQIVTDMLLFDEPIVGAIYSHRRVPTTWVGSGTGSPTTQRRGDFMEVEGVGFGCAMIRRDVVKVMLEKMPEIVDTRIDLHPGKDILKSSGATRLIRAFEKLDIPDRGIVSEDLSFCIRARQCGIATWGAIGHRISHIGDYDFSGRFLDQVEQQQMQQAMAQQQAKKSETPAAPVYPYPVPPCPANLAVPAEMRIAAE